MAALIILIAIAALFAVFDLAGEDVPLIPPLTLDLICLGVGLVPAAIQATRRGFDIFEPIHLVAAALTLITGVRALYLITYQTAVYSRVPSDDLIAAALAISILGIVAVYAGYYSGIGDNIGASMRQWRALWIGERRYPATMIALAALVGLASMAVLGSEIAGVEGQRSVLDAAGLFWLMPLSYCAPFALYMMVLNLNRESPDIARLIAFASMLVVIAAFFLLRPSKDWIIRLFYYPLVFYHYRRGRLPAFKTAVVGAITVTAIFFLGVIGHLYVRKFSYDTADTLRFLDNNLDNPRQLFDMLLSRFYGIDAIAVIVEHVRHTGHFLMGSSLAEMLYWFVPRAIWPGKPITFSFTFGQLFQSYVGWGGEAYASTTLFGELYLNFGLIGVISGSFVFGVLIRAFYSYLIRRVQTKSAIMLYAILLIQSVEFTEGPIGAHVALAISEAAPFLMLLYVTRAATSFGRRA
jgi:oligosaccharide repeat unit polymerase